ncbi:hypothetical protein MUG94_02290 [Arthrobacter gengyunqii]|uniref:DUF2384 domain-containing protein n=1 Tax=Arthrobacter gengyunqii TaxID=2886940 RepID=A0A9X1M5M8_9MICC|nr:hypothetical protein [Arthrobacter gengyunqii]MCC3270754.1 hypothetical protein [Arthrobacter gengyunqii]UOY96634.1 hypothetical protein MUG94_02290 [Arthrobacter gengyunqii]
MSDRDTHQRHSSHPTGAIRSIPSGKNADALWRAMEREHGLYTITEAAQRLGFGYGPNLRAGRLTGKARVLAVHRGNTFLYPGFQFDEPGGRTIPTVKDVVRRGRWAGWTDEQVALWFYSPNRSLQGKRPVDVRDDEEKLISTAEKDMAG